MDMTVSYVTYQLHKNMAHNNGDRTQHSCGKLYHEC